MTLLHKLVWICSNFAGPASWFLVAFYWKFLHKFGVDDLSYWILFAHFICPYG